MILPIRSVAIVGAGTMGLGIAQVCAVNGYKTILFDVNQDQLGDAVSKIEENLSHLCLKNKISKQQLTDALSRISVTSQLMEVKADLIIEAIVENLDVKQKLFAQLEKINDGKAILATNTSSISITKIASALKNNPMCIGYHFFNPADKMKLVEIISGDFTKPELPDIMLNFSETIGKSAVLAKDSPGFIVNRVARHFYLESLKIVEQNLSTPMEIDALLKSSGFRMGPFELIDLIGVDVNLAVTESVYEGFDRISRFKPSVIQKELVKQGFLGKKAKRGFYAYE